MYLALPLGRGLCADRSGQPAAASPPRPSWSRTVSPATASIWSARGWRSRPRNPVSSSAPRPHRQPTVSCGGAHLVRLEFTLAGAVVAVGRSQYFAARMDDLGSTLPAAISGGPDAASSLPAVAVVGLLTAVIAGGIRLARVDAVIGSRRSRLARTATPPAPAGNRQVLEVRAVAQLAVEVEAMSGRGTGLAAATRPVIAAVPGLRVDTRWDGDRAEVAVTGEVDIATVSLLRAALAEAADGGPAAVEVDLSRTAFFDSQGLWALVHARRQLAAGGGSWWWRAPAESSAGSSRSPVVGSC